MGVIYSRLHFALVLGECSAKSRLRCNASLSLGVSHISLPLLHPSAVLVTGYWLYARNSHRRGNAHVRQNMTRSWPSTGSNSRYPRGNSFKCPRKCSDEVSTSALGAGRREGCIRLRVEKGGDALQEGWAVGLPDKIQDLGVQFKFHINRSNLWYKYVPCNHWEILTLKILRSRYHILFSEVAG